MAVGLGCGVEISELTGGLWDVKEMETKIAASIVAKAKVTG